MTSQRVRAGSSGSAVPPGVPRSGGATPKKPVLRSDLGIGVLRIVDFRRGGGGGATLTRMSMRAWPRTSLCRSTPEPDTWPGRRYGGASADRDSGGPLGKPVEPPMTHSIGTHSESDVRPYPLVFAPVVLERSGAAGAGAPRQVTSDAAGTLRRVVGGGGPGLHERQQGRQGRGSIDHRQRPARGRTLATPSPGGVRV